MELNWCFLFHCWWLWFHPKNRSFITSRGGGGGGQFSKRQFWKCTKCEGVEILRHRTGLLWKICQTILRLKQIHVSFKSRQKICFGRSWSATKCYAYKDWPQEPIRYFYYQECRVHVPRYAYAYSWNLEKIYGKSFLFSWKHFYH